MNSNEYMNTNRNTGNVTPVIPLPNPGEGGSAYPGSTSADSGMNTGNGNGGNAGNGNFTGNGGNAGNGSFTGNGSNAGNGNFTGNGSNAGNGGSVSGNNQAAATPVIPLPNPGEGGSAYPGNTSTGSGMNTGNGNFTGNGDNTGISNPSVGSGINTGSGFQGTIITVLPRPVTPCFYCNSSSYGTIRFLNAAVGYNPFVISVNNRTAVDTLEYAEVSEYGRISSGYQTITVSGSNGYIYISKQIRVTVGATMTIAIVNTSGGLDLAEINDVACYTPAGGSCIRVANLSYNAGALTVSTYSGNIVFSDVSFMEVTGYIRAIPARYDIFVANANETLLSTEITARSDSQYTIYLFNWSESPTAVRTLIIEDRK